MPPEEILLVNPNTGTSPVFRSRRDAEITIGIYKRVPVLWRDEPEENPWGLSFMAMFHMANDSGLFRTRDQLERDGWTLTGNVFVRGSKRMLPLYEAKMIHHFDHRLGTYEGQTEAQANMGTLPRLTHEQQDDPRFVVMPRYWVQEFDTLNEQKSKPDKPVYDHGVTSRLEAKHWEHDWLLGWRDICRSTDERTVICGSPPTSRSGHKLPLWLSRRTLWLPARELIGFVFDYVARQKIAGTHLTYFLSSSSQSFRLSAYDELVPWLAQASASQTGSGSVSSSCPSPHGTWRRSRGTSGMTGRRSGGTRSGGFVIRAELDAAFFHLYGLERDDVELHHGHLPMRPTTRGERAELRRVPHQAS